MSLQISGEPSDVMAAVTAFLSRLGTLEKRGPFSATFAIEHPDGLRARVAANLWTEEGGSPRLQTQRRSGDAVLYGCVVKALTKFVRNFESGQPDLAYEFHVGEIMPCPPLVPAQSPRSVPHLALEEVSPFADWHADDLHGFCTDHTEVSAMVNKDEIGRNDFRAHLRRIPKRVLAVHHLSAGLPPSIAACDRVDDVISDALVFWAMKS